MAGLGKYDVHQLTRLCEYLLDGEPVFIIRAQDAFAPEAVQDYFIRSRNNGGLNTIRSEEKCKKIEQWQKEHPERVKIPD